MAEDKLMSSMNRMFDFCRDNSKRTILRTGTQTARAATQALQAIQKNIENLVAEEINGKYLGSISYGRGYFPKVPWVALVSRGKKVSNSISVTICFGKQGDGIVMGAMLPNRKLDGEFKTYNHKRGERFVVDIRGGSEGAAAYPLKFINPKDVLLKDLNSSMTRDHLIESIAIMDAYIKKHS